MNIELATDLIAQGLLDRIDPARSGVVIEVGLGSVNYSFVWASRSGFRCYAIEPLPVPALVTACKEHGVVLTEAALAAERGTASIYLGELNGHAIADVSSLNSRWWGCGSTSWTVATLSLRDFFDDNQIEQVTLLKVDTEGSELVILREIGRLKPAQRPLVVCFEYGGGGLNGSGDGGWAPDFFTQTLEALEVLVAAGYREGFMLEEVLREPRSVALNNPEAIAAFFPVGARGGNLLLTCASPGDRVMRDLIQTIQPALDAEARRALLQGWRMKFDHYRIRAIYSLKRRLVGLGSVFR